MNQHFWKCLIKVTVPFQQVLRQEKTPRSWSNCRWGIRKVLMRNRGCSNLGISNRIILRTLIVTIRVQALMKMRKDYLSWEKIVLESIICRGEWLEVINQPLTLLSYLKLETPQEILSWVKIAFLELIKHRLN